MCMGTHRHCIPKNIILPERIIGIHRQDVRPFDVVDPLDFGQSVFLDNQCQAQESVHVSTGSHCLVSVQCCGVEKLLW